MAADETKYAVASIRGIGDKINEATNLWVDAASLITDAWLPWEALGDSGEEARIDYEVHRGHALREVYAATNALTEVREALYGVADAYAGTDSEVTHQVSRIRTHRPEIDGPIHGGD